MVMPNVKAAGNCPIYGEEHVFNQHYATGSGYQDAYSHTYTWSIILDQLDNPTAAEADGETLPFLAIFNSKLCLGEEAYEKT
jgi:hypothetical protein